MFASNELAIITPVERASDTAASEFALTEAQARLCQMVLDSVCSVHTRRNYAGGLDEVFRFAGGRPLSRELMLEWRTSMGGLMSSTVNGPPGRGAGAGPGSEAQRRRLLRRSR